MAEFKAVYDAEIARVMTEFAEENSKLAAAGKEIKTLDDFKPVTKIAKKTLDGWDSALKDGRLLKAAETIKFHASVELDKNGVIKLDISGLKVSYAEATLEDLEAIFQRVADFKSKLPSLLHRKREEERSKKGGEASGVGREELRNLGFEIADPEPQDEGEEDPMFDETGSADRIDVGSDESDEAEVDALIEALGDTNDEPQSAEGPAKALSAEGLDYRAAAAREIEEVAHESTREWWESEHKTWRAMMLVEEVQIGSGARPRSSTPVLDRFRALKAALKKAAKEEVMDAVALEEALDTLGETALQEAKEETGINEAIIAAAKRCYGDDD